MTVRRPSDDALPTDAGPDPRDGSAAIEASRWAGTLFLGERWLVYDGPLAGTGRHAHHAAQVITASTPFGLVDDDGRRVRTASALIPPDRVHELHADGQRATIVYVEQAVPGQTDTGAPEWASDGRPLAFPSAGVATMAEARARAGALAEVLRRCDASADELVEAAMDLARTALPNPVPLADLARGVHLSPSRLAHRFSAAVGIPVRRWLLWERMQLAGRSLAEGASITDAAHASGFADGSHLNRTFRRMFGVAPSDVAGIARWVVAD
jgi:AraC-like DNA-binding protein